MQLARTLSHKIKNVQVAEQLAHASDQTLLHCFHQTEICTTAATEIVQPSDNNPVSVALI
jgi:hypothetical protein